MKRILIAISMFLAANAAMNAQQTPLWLRSNSISPDGTQIAFTYKGNIYITDAKGGQARQLTTNPAHETSPMWTPDGQNIVFSSTRDGSKDIFIVSAKEEHRHELQHIRITRFSAPSSVTAQSSLQQQSSRMPHTEISRDRPSSTLRPLTEAAHSRLPLSRS